MSGEQAVDLQLCHDWRDKPIIPFKYFVSRSTPPANVLDNLSGFGQLPIEIQFRLVEFCDAQTLFHLIHTTSALRSEAKKYFWSQPDVWFRCDFFLLTNMFGCLGPDLYCPQFAENVQQLDVLFTNLKSHFEVGGDFHMISAIAASNMPSNKLEWRRKTTSDKIASFWSTMQKRFPAIKKVVLSEHYPVEMYPDNHLGIPCEPLFAALVRACPSSLNLEVYVCLTNWVRFTYDETDRLYKLQGSENTAWELIDDNFKRKVVERGAKQFKGVVGQYQRYQFHERFVQNRTRAKRHVLINIWIKYKLANDPAIYVCPQYQYAAPFSTMKEWKRHVLKEKHNIYEGYIKNQHSPPSDEFKFDDKDLDQDVLSTMKAFMKDHETARIGLCEHLETQQQLWGKEGSSKRRQYELAFLAQLELDPQWEGSKPVKKCLTWIHLQRDMNDQV